MEVFPSPHPPNFQVLLPQAAYRVVSVTHQVCAGAGGRGWEGAGVALDTWTPHSCHLLCVSVPREHLGDRQKHGLFHVLSTSNIWKKKKK